MVNNEILNTIFCGSAGAVMDDETGDLNTSNRQLVKIPMHGEMKHCQIHIEKKWDA